MSTIEKLLVFGLIVAAIIATYYIFFSLRKKKKTKEEKKYLSSKKGKKDKSKEPEGEKKVEKVFKSDKEKEEKKEEPAKQEEEKTLEKEPPKKKESFKIIRKKSEVKINKKAINANSRNPSITKVFDKSGNRVDETEKTEVTDELKPEDISQVMEDELDFNNNSVMSDVVSQTPDRFGFREPDIREKSDAHEYKIEAPVGSPNRAPIIGDRTNFGSHLSISEDGNMSGVIGTGVAKIIDKAESQAEEIDRKTEEMINSVRLNLLGDRRDYPSGFGYMRGQEDYGYNKKQETPSDKLKKIDAKTLIIADAISNPRYKSKK